MIGSGLVSATCPPSPSASVTCSVKRRPVLHDVGDAGGEDTAFAGELLVDLVGDAVRRQAQVGARARPCSGPAVARCAPRPTACSARRSGRRPGASPSRPPAASAPRPRHSARLTLLLSSSGCRPARRGTGRCAPGRRARWRPAARRLCPRRGSRPPPPAPAWRRRRRSRRGTAPRPAQRCGAAQRSEEAAPRPAAAGSRAVSAAERHRVTQGRSARHCRQRVRPGRRAAIIRACRGCTAPGQTPSPMPTLLQRFARLLPYVRNSRAGLLGAVAGLAGHRRHRADDPGADEPAARPGLRGRRAGRCGWCRWPSSACSRCAARPASWPSTAWPGRPRAPWCGCAWRCSSACWWPSPPPTRATTPAG